MASPSQERRPPHRFAGWPEEAFELLMRLEGDPPVALRQSVGADRQRLVRQPMIELLQDVADIEPAYDDFTVWGLGKTVWPNRGCTDPTSSTASWRPSPDSDR